MSGSIIARESFHRPQQSHVGGSWHRDPPFINEFATRDPKIEIAMTFFATSGFLNRPKKAHFEMTQGVISSERFLI